MRNINKWDYMKLKSFSTTKVMVSKLNRPPTEWGEILPVRLSTNIDENARKMEPPIHCW
jgi:hypothetical protein